MSRLGRYRKSGVTCACATVLVTTAAMSAPSAPPANKPNLRVVYSMMPMDKIGGLKSGLACLPNGKLRWSDIARPDEAMLEDDLIKASGTENGDTAKVTVSALAIKLCVAWHGVGRYPKGSGSAKVIWNRIFSSGKMPLAKEFVVPIDLHGRDPRTHPAVLMEALHASALMFRAS